MNSRTTSLNKLIYLLSIVVLFTLVFQNVLMSFAEDTGNINVELKYENGDRVSTWQTTLKIFQDNNDELLRVIEFPESNPYEIKSLPLGHKYTIEVFVNDMYAEESFLFLNESEAELQISIPLQAGMQFIVYYNDGSTPN